MNSKIGDAHLFEHQRLTCSGNGVPDVNPGRVGRVPRCCETPARRNGQADDIAQVALMVRLSTGAGVVDDAKCRDGVDDT